MKTLSLIVLLVCAPAVFAASGAPCGAVKCDKVKIDLHDKKSLQRGAHTFVNFCLSCHSAAHMRYNRVFADLQITPGLDEEQASASMIFAGEKPSDLMKAVMPKQDAKDWFGTVPPDLTLLARARSPEWIYTYMRSFYRDEATVSGWNNAVFDRVAMPHVLYEWQGEQRAVFSARDDGSREFTGFEIARPGSMSKEEYDRTMRDLTNFFVYLGDPNKLERRRTGVYVILFLLLLASLAWLLKREYWKDVK